MNAMVLDNPAPVETSPLMLRDVTAPIPGPREIRLRVLACGVCRTDLHVIEGELPPQRPHLIPGHQVVGEVDSLGPGATRFAPGDRAGIAWLRYTCGHCTYCRAGDENLCPNARFTGYHEDGGYAQFAIVHEDFAYRLPSTLDPALTAPLLCGGIIGYRALRRAQVTPGCRLGLYGFGSSAHVCIQIAQHWGCTVYVMTRDPGHQQLARQLGAAWAGGANESPPQPLDSAILFAPVGDLVPTALEGLDRGGTLALAGIHLTQIPPLDYQRHLFYEKNLRSVTANTRRDGAELIALANQIPLKPHITRFKLDQANLALQQMKNNAISGSAVIDMQAS
jgi:propanol-preferring alcohol dehydrogenase